MPEFGRVRKKWYVAERERNIGVGVGRRQRKEHDQKKGTNPGVEVP